MKTAGIIAEWNPFHNGHAHLITCAKEQLHADYCIGVMSPDFVQRGVPAFLDKYVRTEMALRGGVDLVLEMPVRYATGSAEYFAGEGVHILKNLGITDYLCFGAEDPDLSRLKAIASVLHDEPETYRSVLKEALAKGFSYPAARQAALEKQFSLQRTGSPSDTDSCEKAPDRLDLLKQPNNILAVEYLKALQTENSRPGNPAEILQPAAFKRTDSGYHNQTLGKQEGSSFASASAIRSACRKANALTGEVSAFLPAASASLLADALECTGLPDEERFNLLMHYALLRCAASGNLSEFADVSEVLAARITDFLPGYDNYETFAETLRARNIPETRVRRALLHVLLGLKKLPASDRYPGYVRILGFRRGAAPLLRAVKEHSSLTLIARNAQAPRLLAEDDLRLFKEDIEASHLYQLLRGHEIRSEYTRSPVIL